MTSRVFRFLSYSIIAIALIVTIPGCKSRKKNTLIKRAYHNTTAHFNGYFNAKTRIDNAAKQLADSHIDEYDKVLSVFRLGDEKKSKSLTPQLDEAIKKLSLVIQRHEISKWIDDCYLLIGQAYFYKKDYFTAIETFQFVAGKYKDMPAGNEAYIWLIKSYIQLNKLQQAESVINVALSNKTFPKKYLPELFPCIAYFYIIKQNYPKAIEYLQKSLELGSSKSKKSRYTYIIAQLAELIDDSKKAVANYQKVIKMNPPYELAFNAKINSARLFEARTTASKKEIEKQLTDLLKDDKNKEYKDQIYYALGNIYEREGDLNKAIHYYRLSAESSVNNMNQKSGACLKLATIYYNQNNYASAQAYYDSTSTFIAKESPDYDLVNKRKQSLKVLVENLQIITLEDSLQALARLSEKERTEVIDKLIRKEQEEKERKLEQERQILENTKLGNQPNPNLPSTNNSGTTGNTWYFYNTSAVSMGYSEFLKRFGRRPLEDNWRRSNKESITNIIQNTDKPQTDVSNNETGNNIESLRKRYLKNIPLSEEQLNISNEKIVTSLYKVGTFYREELENYTASIKTYETLLSRFPENKFKLETYFNLYRLYLKINDLTQSDLYKNKLLQDYPSSVFAKVIENPQYTTEAAEADKKAQIIYDQLYSDYQQEKYNLILSAKETIDSKYKNTSIAAKYAYLYALTLAKTESIDACEIELNKLISNYPSAEVTSLAKETLKKIQTQKNPTVETPVTQKSQEEYIFESGAKYYYVLCVSTKSYITNTQTELARFNARYFGLENLNISNQLLNDDYQIVIVKTFNEWGKGVQYSSIVNSKAEEVIKIPKTNYFTFIISEKNFLTLIKSKDVQKYLQFYQANYSINE